MHIYSLSLTMNKHGQSYDEHEYLSANIIIMNDNSFGNHKPLIFYEQPYDIITLNSHYRDNHE